MGYETHGVVRCEGRVSSTRSSASAFIRVWGSVAAYGGVKHHFDLKTGIEEINSLYGECKTVGT